MKKERNNNIVFKKKMALIGVGSVLVFVSFWAGYIFNKSNIKTESVSDAVSKYPLIDPSRSLIGQEHFISTLQPLRDKLNEIVDRHSDYAEITVYYEYMNTGANISINQDSRVYPASLVKLPLAIAVMKKIENGIWKLDNKLVLLPADRNEKSGQLYKSEIGTKFTIKELLYELLVRSDNTAFEILFRNMTDDEIHQIIEGTGIDQLFNQEGKLTAREYSRLFRVLYTAGFLNRENSQYILQLLHNSEFNEFINQGLMPETLFAHKWGQNDPSRIYLDAGIIYIPNRPSLITAIVSIKEDREDKRTIAREIMKEIGQSVYDFVINTK